MTEGSKVISEFRKTRELGIKMLETLSIALKSVLDFSRRNNVSIPRNIPYLLQETIRLLQELDSKFVVSPKSQNLRSDEILQNKKPTTTLQNPITNLLDGFVCIPRNKLEDLVMSERKLAEFKDHPDVRTRNLYHFWRGYNSALEKLLEDSK